MNPQTRARAGEVAPPGPIPLPGGSRRSDFMKRAMLVGGAGIAGAMIAGSPRSTDAAQLSQPDLRALNLILLVEYTEGAFYAEAIRRRKLDGELLDYARAVAAQEKEHLQFVRSALGARAEDEPGFDFGDKTGDPDAFATAAGDLEDLAVAAYNGQGTNVSSKTLAAAATIVSVEARHAAWIRSIVGQPPAPEAVDTPRSADEVLDGLQQAGLRR
jgi:Ferritin-like domain